MISKRQLNWFQEVFLGCEDKEVGKAGLDLIKALREQMVAFNEVETECQRLRIEVATQ